MKRYILLYCFSIIAGACFSQYKDTVFFKNGSMVIGKIKKIKLGVLTFDPDDANDITVRLRNMKTLAGMHKIYRAETIDHHVYYGKLLQDTAFNFSRMLHGGDTVRLYLQNISVLYPYDKSFLSRFSGNVGLGYSYTRSSNFGRVNFDAQMRYATRSEELTFTASSIYTTTDSSFTRDNENVSIKSNFYFSPTWFATVFVAYQRNLELGLERRFQEGAGIGNKFLTNKNVYAWGRSGFVFNQEKSTENVTSGTLAEVFGQVEFNFFRFTNPEITFDIAQTVYYSLSQSGRFRNDGQINLMWELIDDLKLNLGFYNNYDSKPPATDSENFDFGVTFGLKYIFY